MVSSKNAAGNSSGFDWLSTLYRYLALALAMGVAGYVSGGFFQSASFAAVSAVPVFLYALFDPSSDGSRDSSPSTVKTSFPKTAAALLATAVSAGVLAGAAAKWTEAFGNPVPFSGSFPIQALYAVLSAGAMAAFSKKRIPLALSLVFAMGAVPCVMSEAKQLSHMFVPGLAFALWVSAFVPMWAAQRLARIS